MKLLKSNLYNLGESMGIRLPNIENFKFPELPSDYRRNLIPKESTEEKLLMFKEGDKMRIPGVLDYTGAKYPFKKIRKGQDGMDMSDNNVKWIRVKGKSTHNYYYVPTRKDKNGKYKAIEYDAQGRYSGYSKPTYKSQRHILSNIPEGERDIYRSLQDSITQGDVSAVKVGDRNRPARIRKLFQDTFGKEVGNDQYEFVATVAANNGLELDDVARKYFELYELSGRPNIGRSKTIFNFLLAARDIFKGKDASVNWNRANINPFTGYIHYLYPYQSITEFGHGFNLSLNEFILLHPGQREILTLYATDPSDNLREVNGKYVTGYDDPNHNEYRAHRELEPLMWRYLATDTKDKSFIDFLNRYNSGSLALHPMTYYPDMEKVAAFKGYVPKIKSDKLVSEAKPIKKGKSGSKLIRKHKSGDRFWLFNTPISDLDSNNFYYNDFVQRLKKYNPNLTEAQLYRIYNVPFSTNPHYADELNENNDRYLSGEILGATTNPIDWNNISSFDIENAPRNVNQIELNPYYPEISLYKLLPHEFTHAARLHAIPEIIQPLPLRRYDSNEVIDESNIPDYTEFAGYNPEEVKLLYDAYKGLAGLAYYGDEELDDHGDGTYGIEEEGFESLVEKGATNTELRSVLFKEFITKYGKNPTILEMDNFIDNYPDEKLMEIFSQLNGYTEEMWNNNLNEIIGGNSPLLDPKKIKKALKYVAMNTPILLQELLYAKSGIKIKKKNRGKFTQYCNGNVTQECINKAKRSGNKTLIKRAVFAENARKWKH